MDIGYHVENWLDDAFSFLTDWTYFFFQYSHFQMYGIDVCLLYCLIVYKIVMKTRQDYQS